MRKRKFITLYTYGGILIFLIFIGLSFLYFKRLERNVISIYIESIKKHVDFLRSYFSSIYPSEDVPFLLDNFIISENLVYVAILDSTGRVRVWKSAFENFLPLNVKGEELEKNIKLISTPLGSILEIKGSFRDIRGKRTYFVAGYPYFIIEEKVIKETFFRTFILLFLTGLIFLIGLLLLIRIQKEVEEKERKISEKEEFIKIATEIAHEIKNPLNVIAMGLQSLEKREHNEEVKKRLVVLRKEIIKLSEYVDNILRLKRPLLFKPERVVFSKLFKEMEILFRDVFLKKGIEFKIQVLNDGYVKGSYELLKQVLINLLKNSFESTEKGEVVLSVKKDKKWIIEVIDTGKGMSDEEIKKVFKEKFTTKKEGSGIGLLWVKKVVEAHEGKVEIESRRGEGTVVRIYLPFRK